MSLVFTIDLNKYRNPDRCPSCETPTTAEHLQRANEEQQELYRAYVRRAREKFKENSLPLCWHCWGSNAETCYGCGIPLEIAFSNEVGNILLRKTTLAAHKPRKEQYWLCSTCTVADCQ